MKYGAPIVHRCPKCRKIVLERTYEDVSNQGAVCYSDSRIEAADNPTLPIFSRCPICGEYCWVVELDDLTNDSSVSAEEVANAPYFELMTLDEIFGFLASGKAKTKEQEYKVRVAIYWNYNDRIRRMTSATSAELDAALWKDAADKERWNDNIEKLYALAEELTPEETPFFAELRRQQGRYAEALAILDAAKDDPAFQTANEAVRSLCELENPYVFIV